MVCTFLFVANQEDPKTLGYRLDDKLWSTCTGLAAGEAESSVIGRCEGDAEYTVPGNERCNVNSRPYATSKGTGCTRRPVHCWRIGIVYCRLAP